MDKFAIVYVPSSIVHASFPSCMINHDTYEREELRSVSVQTPDHDCARIICLEILIVHDMCVLGTAVFRYSELV